MKKSLFWLLTICVLLSVSSVMAQDNQANKIRFGLSVTPLGTQRVGPLKVLDGGGSYDSKRLFGLDATLVYPFSERLSLETGLGFSRQSVTRTGAVVDPTVPRVERHSTLKIWELPVLARYNFFPRFYANGGAIFHVDGSGKNSVLDKQNGVGFQLGFGMDFPFHERLAISVNPVGKFYSAIAFQDRHYPERILLGGGKSWGMVYVQLVRSR